MLVGLVVGHLGLTLAHGVAHGVVPVPIADWQAAYSAAMLFGAPIVGGTLVVTGRRALGAALLVVAGFGALAFEGLAHFVVANPDHIGTVEAGYTIFATTATLSTVGDAALLVGAAWILRTR